MICSIKYLVINDRLINVQRALWVFCFCRVREIPPACPPIRISFSRTIVFEKLQLAASLGRLCRLTPALQFLFMEQVFVEVECGLLLGVATVWVLGEPGMVTSGSCLQLGPT